MNAHAPDAKQPNNAHADLAATTRPSMPNDAFVGLQRGIRQLVEGHELTPSQRRILTYLVEFAADAPFLSAQELARRARVSQPSVTRLAMALGFSGYGALRSALLDLFRQQGNDATDPPWAPAVPTHFKYTSAATHEAAHLAAAAQVWTLSDPPLASIAAQLWQSRPLLVLGLRASAHLAVYASYLGRKIHGQIVAITHGGSTALDEISTARADGATWMIALAMPRYPTETIEAIRHAQEVGLQILLITDDGYLHRGDASGLVTVALPIERSLVFDSHAAPQMIVTMLLEAMCDADPANSERRLDSLDELAGRHETFRIL